MTQAVASSQVGKGGLPRSDWEPFNQRAGRPSQPERLSIESIHDSDT